MRPAEDIKRLIKKLNDKTSAKMDERVVKDVLYALEESEKTSALRQPNTRNKIMKNPVTKFAVAAVIIIAVILGLFELIDTDSSSGLVWAEVVQKVQASRGVIYRTRTIGMGNPDNDWPKAYIIHHKSPLHSRTDWYQDGQIRRIVNFDLSTKTQTWLAYDKKVYNKESMTEETIQSVQNSQKSGWLRPEDITSKILSFEHRKIGTKTIDGVLCEGLETNDPAVCGAPPTKTFVGRLWVSVETRYPVLIEVEATDGEDGSIQMKGFVDQFQWDVEFSSSDRDISIPPDFRPLYEEDDEIKILRQQDKRELLKVEEILRNGAIAWKIHEYKYELSDGQTMDIREAGDGMPVYSQDQFKEFKPKLEEFRQLRKAGQGEDLGIEEKIVEGRVFSFKREKYLLSDGTEFIWSVGTPKKN